MEKIDAGLLLSASRLVNVRYVKVSSAALLLMEGIQLLPLEIQYIWRSNWSVPKILYLLTRYTAYVDLGLSLTHWLAPGISIETCNRVYKAKTCFTYAGIALAELVLIVRTHAIYMRSKKVLYTLLTIWILGVIGNAIIVYYFIKSVAFTEPLLPIIPGCNVMHASPILFICFASFLVFEILIVIMTIKQGYQYFRMTQTAKSRLLVVLYRDGVIYFIVLMLISLGNVIVLTSAPTEYSDLLTTVTRVVHAILCCRILLNLRIARDYDARGVSSSEAHQPLPSLEFSMKFRPRHEQSSIGIGNIAFNSEGTVRSEIEEVELGHQISETVLDIRAPEPLWDIDRWREELKQGEKASS